MTTNNKTEVTKVSLSDAQILALLNAAGLKPAKASPLAGLSVQPASLDSLRSSSVIDNSNRPTPVWREVLAILCAPASEIDLVWGGPGNISLSRVYAAAGQDKFVAFTAGNGTNNISAFLSFNDISDLVMQKTAFTDVKEVAPLNLEAGISAMPAFFAALDAYREEQLKAALERRQEMSVNVNAADLNRTVQEGKVEANYNWYTPAALVAIPPESAVTEESVAEGLNALKKAGIIGKDGDFSDELTTFANRAFPLAGFIGIKIITAADSALEKTQIALFRGLSTLLLVQLESEGNGLHAVFSSIATTRLPELLFSLGNRQLDAKTPAPPAAPPSPAPAAAPKAADTVICSKCGTANKSAAKFCSKCGATLAAAAPAARFCTKCGSPAAGGKKFCKKCGSPIK